MTIRKTGFTLVEMLVASMISAFIALLAVSAMRTVSSSAERVDDNINTACEVRFAAERIATDLINLYRDRNPQNTEFIGTVEQTEQGPISRLVFYTIGRMKARADQPEGDMYEVEYYLMADEQRRTLMRRPWPNPDKDSEAGGILTAIAENIDIFQVRYFDGSGWQDEWPEETGSFPKLVEVTISAMPMSQRDVITESFVVNFSNAAGGEIISLEEAEETEEAAATEEIENTEEATESGNVADVNETGGTEPSEENRIPRF